MQINEVSFETTEESSADGGSFNAQASQQRLTDKADSLDLLASQLARNVQKYPNKNTTLIKRPQDRFVGILQNTSDPDEPTHSEEASRVHRYKNGWLAYWEDEECFKSGEKPKGCISLLRIVKVQHERSTSKGQRGVLVKHKKPSSESKKQEVTDLLLLLPDRQSAKEFSYALWELLQKIRDQWREGQASIAASFMAASFKDSFDSSSPRASPMERRASANDCSSD
eukprot:CAMPEP_0169116086 /NCGR_PEP_ID=MMETSP1015-20121227/29690_1 /TAXON_ID=342587 /ORGANISM="Karlodinium micrum, Strain CCMP2283" /LENGTH=225 /DNA_ID=CAMNT_0009178585 /DNA_START=195 /DNA_END=872 /DNA_ORIENTATION=+